MSNGPAIIGCRSSLTSMTSTVRAKEVAYRYPQNNNGLAPISLSIEPGERLLVTGPSGCGA